MLQMYKCCPYNVQLSSNFCSAYQSWKLTLSLLLSCPVDGNRHSSKPQLCVGLSRCKWIFLCSQSSKLYLFSSLLLTQLIQELKENYNYNNVYVSDIFWWRAVIFILENYIPCLCFLLVLPFCPFSYPTDATTLQQKKHRYQI
jgi:hypothetical protein